MAPMSEPLHLVAIIGSLRSESSNRAVFGAAQDLLPPNVTLAEAPLTEVPLFNADVEAAGDPASVVALRAAVEAADGVLFITPEYNRSIPAVTKNAVDWLSRMPGDSAMSRAKVGIIAATPGRHDAAGVRSHLGESIGSIAGALYEPSLGVSSVTRRFDEGGRLTDQEIVDDLRGWLEAFCSFARTPPPASEDAS